MAFLLVLLYCICVIIFCAVGCVMVFEFAENGKGDTNYQAGLILIKYSLIWPVGLVRLIHGKIEEAEGKHE